MIIVCDYVQAKRKVEQFDEEPVEQPIKAGAMTDAELSAWMMGMEHMLEEGKFSDGDKKRIREKMAKRMANQKKENGAYNVDAELGYNVKRYEQFAGTDYHVGHHH